NWDDKYHKRTDEPTKVCPALLDPHLAERMCAMAVSTFRACHLKDYARVDIRIDPSGRPFVLEINSMASLGDGGSYMKASHTAGYCYASLVNRIVDVAHQRYFGHPAPVGQPTAKDVVPCNPTPATTPAPMSQSKSLVAG